MISKIIIWLALIYIVLVVIWRLIASIIMIVSSYSEDGWGGALCAAALSFLVNLWDLAKFAFFILFVAFIIRSCS